LSEEAGNSVRHINIAVNGNNACEAAGMISRVFFLLGMIAMNLAIVATFFEGMFESGSTIATALATGANFTLSVSLTSSPIHLFSNLLHPTRTIHNVSCLFAGNTRGAFIQ